MVNQTVTALDCKVAIKQHLAHSLSTFEHLKSSKSLCSVTDECFLRGVIIW